MKHILSTRSAPAPHWVGDGFPVHGLFGYDASAAERSPFLLLDCGAPTRFEPTTARRGVGPHPHRGFETVTIVYAGEVEHRDSTGQGGVIGPGDVQWMTAGAGILHEEFHSRAYARTGGPFEMVQLWVNLPARHKMAPPGYQAVPGADIPELVLTDEAGAAAGTVRLIAGRRGDVAGPARTFTPLNVWDVRVNAGHTVSLAQPEGWTCLLVVLAGRVQLNGAAALGAKQMATLSREGCGVEVQALDDAKVLLLAGEPFDEPVVGHGPFVMNSRAEIIQALEDFHSGRFGHM
jgi:redox-sensitive bicupin YhaK (pirin superfamily)